MILDDDGFAVPREIPKLAPVRLPPSQVEMPELFDGCRNRDEAIARAINQLREVFSVEFHGQDEMYIRFANALILLLANQGGLVP
jgi:hypothetical protein